MELLTQNVPAKTKKVYADYADQNTLIFLKAVFLKFHLAHFWIPRPI